MRRTSSSPDQLDFGSPDPQSKVDRGSDQGTFITLGCGSCGRFSFHVPTICFWCRREGHV